MQLSGQDLMGTILMGMIIQTMIEDGNPELMTRNVLTAPVTEVRVLAGSQQPVDCLPVFGEGKLVDGDNEGEDNEREEEAPVKKFRDQWVWKKQLTSFKSKLDPPFPEPNYTRFSTLAPCEIFDLFFDQDVLSLIADKCNEYAMAQFGMSPNITSQEIKIYFGVILLSGYTFPTDIRLYWAMSEDTENKMRQLVPQNFQSLWKTAW